MASAAKVYTEVREYLQATYQPDCDLVDGELEERNLGELEHSEMQEAIQAWFRHHATEWSIRILPEMRIQTSVSRFRVADVAILARDAPREQIITTPPLIAIEILSPDDRVGRYKDRLDDYRHMGVANIWVIDPLTRECFDCSSGSWILTERLQVPESPIYLAMNELELPSFA